MNNLKNLRKKRGLSIKNLHDLTGFPVRTLEDWDANKKPIQAYHRIKKLSEVLECSMDEFMTYEDKCIYHGEASIFTLFQEEEGVRIQVFAEEDKKLPFMYPTVNAIITRENALQLLKFRKDNEDIWPYLAEIKCI